MRKKFALFMWTALLLYRAYGAGIEIWYLCTTIQARLGGQIRGNQLRSSDMLIESKIINFIAP
jgi:hypothetical protein